MATGAEPGPVTVPGRAQQAGEASDVRSGWSWVERCVWTDRMLTALDSDNVRGGKWFRLIDKVYAPRTLEAAFARVKANGGAAGVDHQTVSTFTAHLDENLDRLSNSLRDRSYRPQAIRRVYIPKPGRREKRPLGIPTVRDRVAQTALRSVIEPIFERRFAEHSYGFRPKRSCKDALRRVAWLLAEGYVWVVDADLKRYFDTIPKDRMMERVSEEIADGRVLSLIEAYLNQKVMQTSQEWEPQADEGRGTPQGAVISPLLANVYLNPLDHQMAQAGIEMVRYADDFVLLCRSEVEAGEALERVRQWVEANGLTLHPDKTRLVDTSRDGFEFLGYRFGGLGTHGPSPRSRKRLRTTLKAKTKRTNGKSLDAIITDVNWTLRGWFQYFQHGRRWHYDALDKWIRMRLRSILRRRQHKRGRGRGVDHNLWPNAFFAECGLFCMKAAHAAARQPARQ